MGISTVCDYSRHFLFGHPSSSVQTPRQSALFVFWQKAEQKIWIEKSVYSSSSDTKSGLDVKIGQYLQLDISGLWFMLNYNKSTY
jgi:hypothetical protein